MVKYEDGNAYVIQGTCGTCRFWVMGTKQQYIQDQTGDCFFENDIGYCTAYLDECNAWQDKK